MFLSNLLIKRLSKLLVAVMLFANPAFTAAVYATDAKDNIYTVDKSAKPQTIAQDNSQTNEILTDKEKEFEFGNKLLNYYLKEGQKKGPAWLQRTDFEINFSEHTSPVYSLETVQPFGKLTQNGQQWFWQGRYAREGAGAATANLGFGWRKLSPDKSSLLGLNMFYDYGFQYNLARLGLGGEYFNKLAEYHANWYHPVSSDRLTGVSYQTDGILYSYIRAVEGGDFEAGTSFTHTPWLKIFAGGYFWDNKYHDNEVGYRLRSTMQLSSRLNMELGYTHSNLSHSFYGNMKYQLALGSGKSLEDSKKSVETGTDLSNKLLQRVERDNDIKTETYTKFVAYDRGSLQATVTNSHNDTPISGATVQAYQNGVAVGSAAVTDASGKAVLSGLVVGSYTVYATYATATGTSNVITVTKNATATAGVSLAAPSGNATVHILDANGVAVSGTTVTATLNNTIAMAEPRGMLDTIFGVKTASAAVSSFSVTATTDINGAATFTNLPPGTYHFTVTSNNFSITSEDITISNDNTTVEMIKVPTSGGDIKAVIKDSSQALLSGVAVTVLSGSTTVAKGTTDVNGVATIPGIAAGTYTVSAALADYTTNTAANVLVTTGQTTPVTIALTKQQQQQQTSSLTVTLKDANNNPIKGVAYTIVANGTTYTGTTDSSTGAATLSGLPTSVTALTSVNATGYGTATNVGITWAGSSGTATTSLAKTSLTVTLKDVNNNPIKGVAYTIVANGTTYTGTTDSSTGTTTLSGLPTSVIILTSVTATGYGTATNVGITWTNSSGTATTSLAATSLTVTLKDTNNNPIKGVTYTIVANGTPYTGTTDSSTGTATLLGLPTSVITLTSVTATGYGTVNNVNISWTGSSGTATTSLATATSVTVTLKDANNTSIKGVAYTIIANGTPYTGTTDSNNGTATLSGLPTSVTTLTSVTATGYGIATSINITWNGSSGTATTSLTKTSVTVTLKDANNTSIKGVAYTIVANGRPYTGTTDSSTGTAILSGLPTSATNLTSVTATGYGTATNVSITWNGSTGTTTTLLPFEFTHFNIVSNHGSLLGGATITVSDSAGNTSYGTTDTSGNATVDTSNLTGPSSYTVQFDTIQSQNASCLLGAPSGTPIRTVIPFDSFHTLLPGNVTHSMTVVLTNGNYTITQSVAANQSFTYEWPGIDSLTSYTLSSPQIIGVGNGIENNNDVLTAGMNVHQMNHILSDASASYWFSI